MSNLLIARRYAKALAGVAEGLDGLVQIQQELAAVVSAAKDNADLKFLISYQLLTPAQKAAALDAILVASGGSDTIRKFFRVVIQSMRLNLVYELSNAFNEVVNERMGIVEANVYTAQPMSTSQFTALTEVLSNLTGKQVRINWHQDCSIIGGVRVQVGSTIYDASLKGQLSLIKSKLVLA